MNRRLPIAIVLAGLGMAGLVAIAARAQQAPANDRDLAVAERHDHDRDHDRSFSPADRAAFFDARVAALHAGLTLTADQDKLWPPVETALRDTAKTMADRRKQWRDEPHPADPVQMLSRISEGSIARGEALKKLADAAAPLYASLNDEQKHRLPVLLAHLRPHGLHFAMMDGGRFGQGGERDEWRYGDRERDRDHHDHDGHHDHEDRD